MLKTATSRARAAKAARPATKRKTTVQRFRELPLEERRRRIEGFCDDVRSFWKGKPDTGSVDFLIKSRREA